MTNHDLLMLSDAADGDDPRIGDPDLTMADDPVAVQRVLSLMDRGYGLADAQAQVRRGGHYPRSINTDLESGAA